MQSVKVASMQVEGRCAMNGYTTSASSSAWSLFHEFQLYTYVHQDLYDSLDQFNS